MIDVTSELLSCYADGEVSPEERSAVEEAVARDPLLRAELEELVDLGALFGHVEGEEGTPDFRARLYALRPVSALEHFEVVKPAPVLRARFSRGWIAVAASLLLVAGYFALRAPAEVLVAEVARQRLTPEGTVAETVRLGEIAMHAGETLRSGLYERLAFRLPDAAEVILLPESAVTLEDARAGPLFRIEQGTVLCTVIDRPVVRTIAAGGYTITATRAIFGARVEGPTSRTAGPSLRESRVTIAVTRGELDIGPNGERQTVAAGERLVLRKGGPAERTPAWDDPMYGALFSAFDRHSREILPGFFETQPDVAAIPAAKWIRGENRLSLVVTDPGVSVPVRYLILEVRAGRETALAVTRVRPGAEGETTAECATLGMGEIGPAWKVIAVPLEAFDGSEAAVEQRTIPASRSRLVRIELATKDGVPLDVRTSLWAARRPTGSQEVDR